MCLREQVADQHPQAALSGSNCRRWHEFTWIHITAKHRSHIKSIQIRCSAFALCSGYAARHFGRIFRSKVESRNVFVCLSWQVHTISQSSNSVFEKLNKRFFFQHLKKNHEFLSFSHKNMSWMSFLSCKSWLALFGAIEHDVWNAAVTCCSVLFRSVEKSSIQMYLDFLTWTHVEKIASILWPEALWRGCQVAWPSHMRRPMKKLFCQAFKLAWQKSGVRDNFCYRRTGRKWKEWRDLNLKKKVLPLPGWEKAFVVLSFFRAKWWVTSVAPWNEQNQQYFRDTTTTRKSWPHTIFLFTISLTPIMFVVFVPAKPCSIYDCFNCFFVRWILCSQFASLDTIFYMKLDDFRCNWCELMWPCKFLMFFLRKNCSALCFGLEGLLRVGAFSRSHALLLGGRGSGRHTLVAMASHLLDGIKLEFKAPETQESHDVTWQVTWVNPMAMLLQVLRCFFCTVNQ